MAEGVGFEPTEPCGSPVYTTVVQGTATWPQNIDDLYGSLKFSTSETSKNLIIGIPTAPTFSGTRTFTVRLNNSSGYNVGSPSTVTITITGVPEVDITKVPEVASPGPLITTSITNLGKGRARVEITATDSYGVRTIKRLIVKPKK
jgi:hypothetical protein